MGVKKIDLTFLPSPDEIALIAAVMWLDAIEAANRAGQAQHVALSGGRITQKLFAATVAQSRSRKLSFAGVHFFWADERCVPPEDSESNFRMARELLFAPLNIAPDRIHRIRGEDSPETAAQSAEADLRRVVSAPPAESPVLDLIFLGLGEDGHVASLFPSEPDERVSDQAVYRAVFNSPKPPPRRITLGYPAIAAARQVWMLASGAGKERALHESLQPDGQTPFARVLRLRAQTKILTDISLDRPMTA